MNKYQQNKKRLCGYGRLNNCSWLLVWLLLACFSLPAMSQITVSGVVNEASGEPLPGTNVTVKGTSTGTITDTDGKYTIAVPDAQSVLVFSFMGYINQEITVGDMREINITMSEDVQQLQDVVVIGYGGTMNKRDVTGAISSVGEKVIAEKQAISVYDALQGSVPGVQVFTNNGAPGGDMSIRIRGTASLTDDGVQPLYIVDGMQMSDINTINPNDIRSMEILKDGASAAIYGSRSANGVVIITTKQGVMGKPRFDFKFLTSYNQLSHKLDQSSRFDRSVFIRGRGGALFPNTVLNPFSNDSLNLNSNSDNDYQDIMTQQGVRRQYDFSISGGTEKLKYRASAQYLDEKGIIINSYFKRFSGRFNITYDASDRLTLRTNIDFSYTDKNIIDEGNVIKQAMQRPPDFTLYYPDGSLFYINGGRRNPIAESMLRKNVLEEYRGSIFQDFDFKITNWLTLHGDIAVNVRLSNNSTFVSKLLDTSNPPANSGRLITTLRPFYQGNAWLQASKKYGNHSLSGNLGATFEKYATLQASVGGRMFPNEGIQTLNGAGEYVLNQLYSDESAYTMAGFFGRISYDYEKRYLLNATMRIDGSSRFGSESRWGYFPSASIAWRFSDEEFMQWASGILSDGKVRFSWGVTGNQSIGNYDSKTQIVTGSYQYNGVTGYRVDTRMGNDKLRWEQTVQNNVGLDLELMRGKVNFSVDYYVKNTKDLLFNVNLPYEFGYSTGRRENLGELRNRGIELQVTWNVINNHDFSWTTTANWFRNVNRINKLPGVDYVDGRYKMHWVGVGHKAGTFYGWKALGIYRYNESNAWTYNYEQRLIPVFKKDEFGNDVFDDRRQLTLLGYTYPDGTPYEVYDHNGNLLIYQQKVGETVLVGGDFIYEELPNEEGMRTGEAGATSKQVMGSVQPEWNAGWQNTIRYKSFRLSFNFYASIGGKVYNDVARERLQFSIQNISPSSYAVHNMWKYPGQYTDIQRSVDFEYNWRRGNMWFLEDATFIRLQNLRFTYDLPKEYIQKVFLQNVQVYVYGNNLLTWTNYTGFDPEVDQNRVLNGGVDGGQYPKKREYGFGINLNF